jgi:hypothetical protein
MQQFAEVVTFRIADVGLRIKNTETNDENYLTIPQAEFPNPQSI